MSPPHTQPGSLVLLGTAPAPKDSETLARPPPESNSQGDTGKFITPHTHTGQAPTATSLGTPVPALPPVSDLEGLGLLG